MIKIIGRAFSIAERSPKPKVYLQVSRDGEDIGKMVFELYQEESPRTVRNFLALISGDNKDGLKYEGTPFHRIVTDFMV